MEVIGGGGDTLQSAVRPFGMGISPNETLDMSEYPNLMITYLLKGE